MTYIDAIKLKFCKKLSFQYDIVAILISSLLIGISSKINFVLPFTPVPVTMQTFSVLFLSMVLGKEKAFTTILIYIFEGVAGLPVFAKGGGVQYLLGPTGGYVIGFLFGGYVVGWLSELGFDKKFFLTVIAMTIGNLIIYFFGVLWLSVSLHIGVYKAILLGMVPFIYGDFIKIFFASLLLPTGWKILKKFCILS